MAGALEGFAVIAVLILVVYTLAWRGCSTSPASSCSRDWSTSRGHGGVAGAVRTSSSALYAPIALSMLDIASGGRRPHLRRIAQALVSNPVSIAAVLGVVISSTNATLPRVVHDPLELLGQLAVPGALLAFGVSMRFGPRVGAGQGGHSGSPQQGSPAPP